MKELVVQPGKANTYSSMHMPTEKHGNASVSQRWADKMSQLSSKG